MSILSQTFLNIIVSLFHPVFPPKYSRDRIVCLTGLHLPDVARTRTDTLYVQEEGARMSVWRRSGDYLFEHCMFYHTNWQQNALNCLLQYIGFGVNHEFIRTIVRQLNYKQKYHEINDPVCKKLVKIKTLLKQFKLLLSSWLLVVSIIDDCHWKKRHHHYYIISRIDTIVIHWQMQHNVRQV